jgi:hypothetical protein
MSYLSSSASEWLWEGTPQGDVSSRACHERFVEDNFLPIKIKVRSCRQQASSSGHSRRVDERATLNKYATDDSRTTSSVGTTATTLLHA